MLQKDKQAIRIRKTNDFFLKNFKPFHQDLGIGRWKQIQRCQFECLGYGVFAPDALLENFAKYLFDMIDMMGKEGLSFKFLKITLSGFTLNQHQPILQQLAKKIPKIRTNLSTLEIKTANLKNVTLKDFNQLLRLLHHLSDINFENYTLQCANWIFVPRQPNFKQLHKIFGSLIQQSQQITKILNQKFRLEMSGWYYTVAEAHAFFGFRKPDSNKKSQVDERNSGDFVYTDQLFFKEQQKFFVEMQNLIKELLDVMDNITELQLDMRNNNQVLKLKQLKKRLDNISKNNRCEKSLVSKRPMEIMPDENQKQLKLTIVM